MATYDRQTDAGELRQAFDKEGYVHIRGFLDAEQLADVHRRLERFFKEVVPSMSSDRVYYEDVDRPETLKQLQHIYRDEPYFDEMFTKGAARRLAEVLLGDDVVPRNMQYFNKPAGVGRPTPPHQDGFYFMLEPCAALTMWLALEDVDERNGCVRYIPGSHQQGLRSHAQTGTLGFSQGIVDYGEAGELEAEVACVAKAGDLLAHHALTIHRADGNTRADRTRQALGLIYYAAAAREDRERHASYQQELARRLTEERKIAAGRAS